VDLAMMHDSGGPRRVKPMLERLGAKVWDPSKVVVITDHYVPTFDDESRKIVASRATGCARPASATSTTSKASATWCCPSAATCARHVRGRRRQPLAHRRRLRRLHVRHRRDRNARACWSPGEIWLKVPHTIAMEFSGKLATEFRQRTSCCFLIGRFGLDGGQYQAVEYRGAAIRALPMQERMTLCNMTAELGGQTGLIASDSTTEAFLNIKIETWESDSAAPLMAHHRFNASDLAPQVAAPHSPRKQQSGRRVQACEAERRLHRRVHRREARDLRMAACV
jgi:3-isopropylmalate/(R)-2-methylmalate dehydratase large subunit